ncbi:MAG TPA: serine/threonine-protein kinase [Kofleriaceae bacterium]|nr:serine/threonine-protein kinase [Kofleriaceae bacterium]
MAPEAAQASEARRFGKYTLVAKLATGGMAEIFLARLHGDGGFEKLVCIKRILPHLAKNPQFVAMFLDEARVAARISHPNVCQVFELGEFQGQYYIAMEYLEGVPLAVFRRKDFYPTPPQPRLVAGFAVQACEGLHHAHQLKRADGELLGVVHRDISPQNLFATVDGIVKVLDFGIAKVQDQSIRTSTGAVKGTYAYMAPEQLRNEGLDRRADVWAIGAVLWETLAQTHLFKRDTEFLTFEAITKLPIPHLCEVRPDVPPLMGDVIARALSRNPDDRFGSARSLGEAIAQAVAPLGGPFNAAGISEEVGHSFEATLAEQRMLLRIAREGGQFDLETSSPLVGHGSAISSTPVSNIHRRAQEAQQEVAQFVAAKQAIDSLDFDDSSVRPARFGTDGAFTPAPSRRSDAYASAEDFDDQETLMPMEAQKRRSAPMAAQRRSQPYEAQQDRPSGPYSVAPREWRYDETEPPIPQARQTMSQPAAPIPSSRLPWFIALIAVAAAAGTGVMLYMKLQQDKQKAQVVAAKEPVDEVKMPEATPPPVVVDAAVPVVEQKVEVPVVDEKPVEKPEDKVADKPIEDQPPKPPIKKKTVKIDKKVETKKPEEKKPLDDKKPVEDKKPEPAVSGPPGFITIDSTPVYAVIYVDGKKLGETPLVNIKLAPGKHAVRAVSPSGSARNLSITIEAGKTAPVKRIEW